MTKFVPRAARIPKAGLARLALLRRHRDIRVTEFGDEAWIAWPGDQPEVIEALRSIEGATFYHEAPAGWVPQNQSLPDFHVPPTGISLPLDHAILPERFEPITLSEFRGKRIPVELVPCDKPRPTTALRCSLPMLASWCDRAPSAEIEAVRGAWNGSTVWLLGKLPAIANAERFWGQRVLVPLGWRPEPDWPESALLNAAMIDEGEMLVLENEGPTILPTAVFQPLSRANVRKLLERTKQNA